MQVVHIVQVSWDLGVAFDCNIRRGEGSHIRESVIEISTLTRLFVCGKRGKKSQNVVRERVDNLGEKLLTKVYAAPLKKKKTRRLSVILGAGSLP